MDLSLVSFLIVCPLVFLASFADAIAGGGGLISLPAYLLAGIPIHNAIATNKLSSATGTVISTVRYCKNRYADVPLAIPSEKTHEKTETSSGNTKLVNLAAVATFFYSDKIVLSLGLAAAVFSVAGHYIGSGLVIKNGTKIVRPIVIVVLLLLFIKIISGFF